MTLIIQKATCDRCGNTGPLDDFTHVEPEYYYLECPHCEAGEEYIKTKDVEVEETE